MTRQTRDALELKHRERERQKRERGRSALAAVLATPHGAAACWYLLGLTNIFAVDLWSPNSEIHKNVAVRDFGVKMMALMVDADPNAMLDIQRQMWHEAVAEMLEDEKILREQEEMNG